MPRGETTRAVSRSESKQALGLASELLDTAQHAQSLGHWRAAALNAVHAGIAAGDAALIAVAGIRSAAQDHGAAVALLQAHVPAFKAANRRQLTGLLKEKSAIAYEQRHVTEVQARVMLDQATRLVEWAEAIVAEQTA